MDRESFTGNRRRKLVPWLVKSEPSVYSIEDLRRDQVTSWEGVRNYQARNFMRDMQPGDKVLFYHSNATPPGVAGIAQVRKRAYPDPTQFDSASPYFDAGSKNDAPRWDLVEVAFERAFERAVTLEQLRSDAALAGLLVTARGSRLSVVPVSDAHFARIVTLAES